MDANEVRTYLTGRNGSLSLMNRINLNDYLTESDYINFEITDQYQYRLDKISEDFIGHRDYYFFIIWLNDIESLDDIVSGEIIKVPKLSFIKKVRKDIKVLRGV